MRRFAEEIVTNFDVRTPSLDVQVRYFQGVTYKKSSLEENCQRNTNCLLLIILHEDWMWVTEYVHKQLFKQKDSGVGVLLLS